MQCNEWFSSHSSCMTRGTKVRLGYSVWELGTLVALLASVIAIVAL